MEYGEDLGDGLILRTVRDERDAERFADFSTAITGAAEGLTCACLASHHPGMSYDDFLLVEDGQTGEIVSTTCLIPWRCRYEDVTLDVAMLEMVVTHPQCRHRGLIRTQVERFHQVVSERRFDLSIVQGIPYYYRQYGYAYAIDNEVYDSLPVWRIPDPPAGHLSPSPYRLRQATLGDVPALAGLYQDAMAGLQIHTLRSPDYWRYLVQGARFPLRLAEDQRDGRPVGYMATTQLADARGMRVVESGITSQEVGWATLCELKAEAAGEIQLSWPQTGRLVQLGRSLGSVPLPAYQWLLRISDIVRFLTKIGRVLERRLAVSGYAGLTSELCLNLFHQAFVLSFEAGKLSSVTAVGFVDSSMGADGGDLCIPLEAFVRLVVGYRDLDQLRDAWPDIVVRPRSRHLIDTLFPTLTSYLCMPYHYCGPAS